MTTPQHATALLEPVLAYIGPGVGLGAIIVTVALALGAILLVGGLVWYPLKRLIRGAPVDTDSGSRTDAVE